MAQGTEGLPKKSTGRLITGIIAIVLSVLVLLQSCTVAGLGAMVDESAATSGFAGVLVALMMLAGGIVDIATRGAQGKAGSIASIVLYGLAALMAVIFAADFSDLSIWAGVCLIFAIVDVVVMVRRK